MLWFLSIAVGRGFIVDSYRDEAVGVTGKNEEGKIAITCVTLRPDARFIGRALPLEQDIIFMHNEAHEKCFIANSVKTKVLCEPVIVSYQS